MSSAPNQTTPINRLPLELELADVLELLKKEILLQFNCHHLATVQSFNTSNQTAQATLNYQKTFFELDASGNYVPFQMAYPLLADCPVIILSGHNTALTFPIAQGDECLVLFNDRDIDNWFVSGANSTGILNSPRLHSFADGLILVGLRSKPKRLSNYNTTHAVIRNDAGAQVGVHDTTAKVLVGNNTTTLNTQLQALITAIQALTVNLSTGNINPSGALSSVATALSGLLE